MGTLGHWTARAACCAAALSLCIALAGSCTRQRAPQAQNAPANAPARTPEAKPLPAPGGPAGGQQKQPGPQPSPAPAPPARPQPAAPAAGTAALLLLGPSARALPEDFEIGPLADPRGGSDDEKAAVAAAAAFLSSVAAGAPDGALLASESREAVLDLLGPAAKPGAERLGFRLGRPATLPGGELSMNLRLLRGAATAEGEVYARRAGTRWELSDVQVNPADLAVARDRPAGRFFPSPYRWLLGGSSAGAGSTAGPPGTE